MGKTGLILIGFILFISCSTGLKEIPPGSPAKHHNDMGLTYLKAGDIRAAIMEFSRAISLEPRYVEPQFNLGLAYYQGGMINAALVQFEKTTDLDPTHDEAYYQIGLIYHGRGNFEAAVESYRRAIKKNPRPAPTRPFAAYGSCMSVRICLLYSAS